MANLFRAQQQKRNCYLCCVTSRLSYASTWPRTNNMMYQCVVGSLELRSRLLHLWTHLKFHLLHRFPVAWLWILGTHKN